MVSASPLHHQQSLLEGIIDFTAEPPLRTDQRSVATAKFNRIIDYYDIPGVRNSCPYNRSRLIRFTHQYALSEQSQDNLLRVFFGAINLSVDNNEDIVFDDELQSKFFGFADYLLDSFFLPLKASARKTPQPTPTYHSVVQEAEGAARVFVGTQARVSALRGECLLRDRHRCVISRAYSPEAAMEGTDDDDDAGDDDRNPFGGVPLDMLEVAHILPYSLVKVNATDRELDRSREAALSILNIFDHGVTHLIEGADNIDRPRNALTLTPKMRSLFGDFRIFFEAVKDAQQPHTYRIDTFLPQRVSSNLGLPVTRTLYVTENRTIDPPSPRLLAIHCAIAHVLHFSAAGEYIDQLLRDMEDAAVRADGSIELGRLVQLGLGVWCRRPMRN